MQLCNLINTWEVLYNVSHLVSNIGSQVCEPPGLMKFPVDYLPPLFPVTLRGREGKVEGSSQPVWLMGRNV